MTSDKKQGSDTAGTVGTDKAAVDKSARPARKRRKPEWASGLKQIYDSVVDEPMPDNFAALLAQLDDEGK